MRRDRTGDLVEDHDDRGCPRGCTNGWPSTPLGGPQRTCGPRLVAEAEALALLTDQLGAKPDENR